jgi:hypothetical protein
VVVAWRQRPFGPQPARRGSGSRAGAPTRPARETSRGRSGGRRPRRRARRAGGPRASRVGGGGWGGASESVASSPIRRRSNAPSGSSPSSRRGVLTRSPSASIRPRRDIPSQPHSSRRSVGIPNGPLGKRRSPWSVQTNVTVVAGATSSRARPSSRASWTAHGLRAISESGPASIETPPTSTEPTLPPGSGPASRTVTSRSFDETRRYAVARPATPPPTTTTPLTLRPPRPGAPSRSQPAPARKRDPRSASRSWRTRSRPPRPPAWPRCPGRTGSRDDRR